MNIDREDRKCVCCKKVFIRAFLMETGDKTNEVYVVCPCCANDIYEFYKKIIEAK